ncbi:hypothetical protein U1Q18_037362, partial [Sarracenia purpurea var. burkii]
MFVIRHNLLKCFKCLLGLQARILDSDLKPRADQGIFFSRDVNYAMNELSHELSSDQAFSLFAKKVDTLTQGLDNNSVFRPDKHIPIRTQVRSEHFYYRSSFSHSGQTCAK